MQIEQVGVKEASHEVAVVCRREVLHRQSQDEEDGDANLEGEQQQLEGVCARR